MDKFATIADYEIYVFYDGTFKAYWINPDGNNRSSFIGKLSKVIAWIHDDMLRRDM